MATARKGRRWRRWLLGLPLLFVTVTVLQVLALRWIPPFGSAFMAERQVSAWWHREPDFHLHYAWRPWSRISPNLPISLVAAEDQKFPFHHGFDFEAIDKAIDHNARSKRVRGASTMWDPLESTCRHASLSIL